MIRLTRKAWNNVLIFATLFMILLFNSTHKLWLDNTDGDAAIPLLPEHASLLTIEYGDVTLERIGRGWRLKPARDVESGSLEKVAAIWQNTFIVPAEVDSPLTAPFVVVVWLAGETEGRVFKVFDENSNVIEYKGEYFKLTEGVNAALFVPGVM